MIASMLKLGRSDCKALTVKDAYSIHRIVYSLFPKENTMSQRDFLFADKGGNFNTRKILILSKHRPSIPEFGEIESKEVPDKFLSYKNYGFETVLNPVVRNGLNKTAKPVKGADDLRNWFLSKSVNSGFAVEPESLQISRVGVVRFDKVKDRVKFQHTHNTATFTGKLNVVDDSLFIKSFEEGIGRAKGFGFGLLQLIPLKK